MAIKQEGTPIELIPDAFRTGSDDNYVLIDMGEIINESDELSDNDVKILARVNIKPDLLVLLVSKLLYAGMLFEKEHKCDIGISSVFKMKGGDSNDEHAGK